MWAALGLSGWPTCTKSPHADRSAKLQRVRRYRLEALKSLRARQSEDAAQAVASKQAQETQRQHQLESAQAAAAEAQEASTAVREAERQRLEEGALRARDLADLARWEQGEKTREQERERQLSKLDQRLQDAREQTRLARARSAQAEAASGAVKRHHESWQAQECRRRDAAEEEAADEWTVSNAASPPTGKR